ncbi:MAG: biotin/lipoate--protein ligase family protein [Paracoccus sp. (in: a-proteobacteria)]|nr:biotin/lipoate--protein ligase family protein [Paracoccus sp. (in: a-proteobacteria)]
MANTAPPRPNQPSVPAPKPGPAQRPPKGAPRRLILPPPYSADFLPEGEVFERAVASAESGEAGAGDLLWTLRAGDGAQAGRLDFALVVEPEQAMSEARLGFVAGLVALAEAVAANGPPERRVAINFPAGLRFDTMRLGGMRLAHDPVAEDETPAWMVMGAELCADRAHLAEPGDALGSTSLDEEGFDDPAAIVESFAAFFMLYLDRWKHQGADALLALYTKRLAAHESHDPGDFAAGLGRALADKSLAEGWRDPAGGPRI